MCVKSFEIIGGEGRLWKLPRWRWSFDCKAQRIGFALWIINYSYSNQKLCTSVGTCLLWNSYVIFLFPGYLILPCNVIYGMVMFPINHCVERCQRSCEQLTKWTVGFSQPYFFYQPSQYPMILGIGKVRVWNGVGCWGGFPTLPCDNCEILYWVTYLKWIKPNFFHHGNMH